MCAFDQFKQNSPTDQLLQAFLLAFSIHIRLIA